MGPVFYLSENTESFWVLLFLEFVSNYCLVTLKHVVVLCLSLVKGCLTEQGRTFRVRSCFLLEIILAPRTVLTSSLNEISIALYHTDHAATLGRRAAWGFF